MNSPLLHHVAKNWPLAAAICVLLLYLPFVLISKVVLTNQGKIPRSADPQRYWRWVRGMTGLLLVCIAVLLATYLAGPAD